MSVPVGSPRPEPVNHVYLVVPVVITCPVITLNPDEIIQGENVDVRVTEKVGGSTIVSGEGSIGYDDGRIFGGGVSGTLLTCDGQPHTYPVTVFPAINDNSGNGTGVAFKGGKAVAQASFEILLRDKVTFAFDDNAVGSGLTSVNIRG